jgi:2-keto-4-pentenoate hydratase
MNFFIKNNQGGQVVSKGTLVTTGSFNFNEEVRSSLL